MSFALAALRARASLHEAAAAKTRLVDTAAQAFHNLLECCTYLLQADKLLQLAAERARKRQRDTQKLGVSVCVCVCFCLFFVAIYKYTYVYVYMYTKKHLN